MSQFSKIITKIRTLSYSDHKYAMIAKYIIINYKNIINFKISELANETYSSPATISRFVRYLGLERYTEFQHILKYHFNNIENEKQRLLKNSAQAIPELIQNTLESFNNTLQQTTEILDRTNINETVAKICTASEIIFLASGTSFLAANDFAQRLIRIGLNIKITNDLYLQKTYCCLSSSDSLIIAISYSGYNKFVLNNLKIAIGNKSEIITVTKKIDNEMTNYAIIQLFVLSDESIDRYDSSLSRLAFIYLFDILFMNILYYSQETYISNLKNTKFSEH